MITVAVWPESETDKARADGKELGQAVGQLYDALNDISTAAGHTRDHAGDAVADQVSKQDDALSRAVDGFAGVHSATDAFDVDVYQAELNTALDDLTSNADHFRAQGSDVQQAFWDGFDDGLSS